MWILDRIFPRSSSKKRRGRDPIVRHELYEKIPGGEWRMTRAQPEAVDFDQLGDPMPGCSYRLYSRHKSGKFKILWYHHLEGPGPVQEATFTSLEDLKDSLELMIRYGKAIGDFQEDIRGAFGWVFPEKEQPGGWLWPWENKWVYQPPSSQPRGRVVGDVMRSWLTVMESAVESANRMDIELCVRLLAAQLEAEAAEKSSPQAPVELRSSEGRSSGS